MKKVLFFLVYGWFAGAQTLQLSDDVIINVLDNNATRPIGEEFVIKVQITNTADDLREFSVKHLHSERVTISSMVAQGGNKLQYPKSLSTHNLKSTFPSDSRLEFELTVRLNADNAASGYHVDNILLDFYWTSEGLNYRTGYVVVVLPFITPGCNILFDVENGKLRADQVSASTSYANSPPQSFGPNSKGWCANVINDKQYLEVLFDKTVRIISLCSGPRIGKKDEITDFLVVYLKDGHWHHYLEHGLPKLFRSVGDITNETREWLVRPIECDGIRIHPINWNSPLICARISIFGCYISKHDNCIKPIGMESGEIPWDSLVDNTNNPANGARLNKETEGSSGWAGDWLQVDLGSLFKVTRVSTQAGHLNDGIVTQFSMIYSNNSDVWYDIFDADGKKKVFENHVTESINNHVSIFTLPNAITTRSVRIVVGGRMGTGTMRMELYGCPVTERAQVTDGFVSARLYKRSVLVDKLTETVHMCQYSDMSSSCFASNGRTGFKTWKGEPSHIVHLLGVDHHNRTYALTNRNTVAMKKREEWREISRREWNNSHMRTRSVTMPTIIARNISDYFHWEMRGDENIAISGEGMHVKLTDNSQWQRVASWYCCGR